MCMCALPIGRGHVWYRVYIFLFPGPTHLMAPPTSSQGCVHFGCLWPWVHPRKPIAAGASSTMLTPWPWREAWLGLAGCGPRCPALWSLVWSLNGHNKKMHWDRHPLSQLLKERSKLLKEGWVIQYPETNAAAWGWAYHVLGSGPGVEDDMKRSYLAWSRVPKAILICLIVSLVNSIYNIYYIWYGSQYVPIKPSTHWGACANVFPALMEHSFQSAGLEILRCTVPRANPGLVSTIYKSGFGAHSGIASQDQSMATFDKKSNKNRNVFWFIASPACGLKPPTPIHGKVFPAIRDSAELSPAVGVDRHRSRSSSLASIPQHERTGNERGGHAPVWWEMSPTNFIIGDLWRFYFIIGFFRGSTGTQLFGKASGSGTNGGSCLKQKCQKQKYKLSWATWMLT